MSVFKISGVRLSWSTPGRAKARNSMCELVVVVEALGLQPASHEVRPLVSTSRWPHPGMTLPCRIDSQDPDWIEIEFDAITDWRDQARASAAAQAEAIAAGGTADGLAGAASFAGGVTVVGASSHAEAEAGVGKAEQVLGVDLDGDGQIG